VNAPANVGVFFSYLLEVIAFDFIDTGDALDWVFGLDPSQAVNASLETLGFESKYFLQNIGTVLIFFVIYALLIASSKAFRLSPWDCMRDCGESLKKYLCYSPLVTLIMESYFVLAVSCMVSLTNLSWGSFGETFMSLSGISCLALLIGFPFGYSWFLWKRFEALRTKAVK